MTVQNEKWPFYTQSTVSKELAKETISFQLLTISYKDIRKTQRMESSTWMAEQTGMKIHFQEQNIVNEKMEMYKLDFRIIIDCVFLYGCFFSLLKGIVCCGYSLLVSSCHVAAPGTES